MIPLATFVTALIAFSVFPLVMATEVSKFTSLQHHIPSATSNISISQPKLQNQLLDMNVKTEEQADKNLQSKPLVAFVPLISYELEEGLPPKFTEKVSTNIQNLYKEILGHTICNYHQTNYVSIINILSNAIPESPEDQSDADSWLIVFKSIKFESLPLMEFCIKKLDDENGSKRETKLMIIGYLLKLGIDDGLSKLSPEEQNLKLKQLNSRYGNQNRNIIELIKKYLLPESSSNGCCKGGLGCTIM